MAATAANREKVKRVQLNSIQSLFNLRKYFSKNPQFDIYLVQIVNKNSSAYFWL